MKSAENWIKNDPNPTTAHFVNNLVVQASDRIDKKAIEELGLLFPTDGSRISFGTAGLRAAMKPGPLGMNDLTIVQTAQGLARYCLKQDKIKNSDTLCAVIAYDHRSNPELQISSLSFAILTALVFAEAGIDCVLLEGFVLTPLVPFSCLRLGAVTGIMVTASHNPKQDNGYKVYASDGCQIRAPMDKEISAEIMDNLEPWKDYGKIIKARRQEYKDDPCLGLGSPEKTKEFLDEYFAAILNSGLKTGQATIQNLPNSAVPPSFAYSAMHGIGHRFASRVFEVFELPPFKAVPSQKDPDYTFPTVPFPNPEEKGALDLAKKYAEENGCDIVLANDPDADRLAVAEKDRSNGKWTVFTGDQIGTMLGHWIWNQIGKNCGKVSHLFKYKISLVLLCSYDTHARAWKKNIAGVNVCFNCVIKDAGRDWSR